MLDKTANLTRGEVTYPMAFSFNVMEEIQEFYGSVDEWSKKLSPSKNEEIMMRDIIWTFRVFINEGIDIENEKTNSNRTLLTHKQVGRLLTGIEKEELAATIHSLVSKSTKTDNPNAETT